MSRPAKTIDEYLAAVEPEQRVALEHLRKTIHAIVPGAIECISYKIPAVRVDGVVVAGFAAWSAHCSYFPFSGSTLRRLAADVARYEQTKSALHFSPNKPLPKTLVRKLLKARLAEVQDRRY